MNAALLAKLLQGVVLVNQVVQMGIQAGQTIDQLKAEFERLKQLAAGTPLTEEQSAALYARHADLTTSWLQPLGPRPSDAA